MSTPVATIGAPVASRRRGWHAAPAALVAILCAAVFVVASIDLLAGPRDALDRRLLAPIERVDLPGLEPAARAVGAITAHWAAIAIWAALIALSLVRRWWLPALTLIALPVGGLLNHALSALFGRGRPGDGETLRAIADGDALAAAGGHVVGAVLLYGLIFIVADGISRAPLRRAIKLASALIVVATGFVQVRYGPYAPSDVTAAYAFGGLILCGLVAVYRRIDAVTGPLPLVHAAIPPHDEQMQHAHALTSLVLFEGETVEKIYGPGFLPRLIYWLAFQAEFPYIRNRAALEAARHRRNLAAMLTEYWYGSPRVARVIAIEPAGDGFAVRSELVEGHAPRDRRAARAFLADLKRRFEDAGYPTWQIDPRQPRAVDNVLETDDGGYMIVDLESGLVSPLASLRSWGRAFRRGLVPIFDDVYFDLTRAYVEREGPAMRAALGDAWVERLLATLAAAERETAAWRASEPRLWSHLVYNLQRGLGLGHRPAPWLPARARASGDVRR